MAVFTLNTLLDLTSQARRIANNFFAAHPLTITADEFIEGFINPDHVPILKQTEEICGRIGNTSSLSLPVKTHDGNGFPAYASFAGESPIIIPEYVRNGLRPEAPQELRTRFQEWVEQRWSYGCTFGDSIDALYFLNEVCGDARAMTVMMPILPTLMRNINIEADSRTSKRAKRLAELTGVGSLPNLPRKVTQRIQEVCHLMTAVNLIENVAAPKVQEGGASISYLNGYETPKRPSMFAGLAHVPKNGVGSFS